MVSRPLLRHDGGPPPPGCQGYRFPLGRLRRLTFLLLVGGTTSMGVVMMASLLGADGFTLPDLLILGLFTVTFGWITIAYWTAAAGLLLVALRRDPLTLRRSSGLSRADAVPRGRTALVMPVRNEDPASVGAGLGGLLRSLTRTGHAGLFDAYLLSDSDDPNIVRAEETAWARLRDDPGFASPVYYRRRASNEGRKAGNIADFCRRWGSRYDFMVVLDADSVMEGGTVVELVRTMEAHPDLGLVQTLPSPVWQNTLFGRVLQFARWLYGPMVATGLSFWQTDAGNYWGHNAIVRVKPFIEHCGLPTLSGKPPLGGEILSHDFVEAALMRGAGWKVLLMPGLGGSYEDVPGNLLDYADRDRRWSQGNLQHLRLLRAPGLHPVSRAQLALGALSYLTSPLWLTMLAASTLYAVLTPGAARPSLPGGEAMAGSPEPSAAVVPLLAAVVVVLFLPKVLAITLAVVRHPGAFGGRGRLAASGALEMIAAVLLAPLMMVYHSYFVISVLRGKAVSWRPQARGGRAVPWMEAWRRTGLATCAGVVWAAVALLHGGELFLWLTPVFTGLILAAPLVRWTSGTGAGAWTRRQGLFLAPCETAPRRVLEEIASIRATEDRPVAIDAAAPGVPEERPRAMIPQPLTDRRPSLWKNLSPGSDSTVR